MKRMIACVKCAARPEPKYAGEWFKRVMGTAKRNMFCDYCNNGVTATPIEKGDICAAESMAPDYIPYFQWEGDFIFINAHRPHWENHKKEATNDGKASGEKEKASVLYLQEIFKAGR